MSMMQETEKYVYTDSAALVRIAGGIFMLASGAFWLVRMDIPGVAFLAAGLILLLIPSDLTVTADRATRILRLEYQHLLFRSTRAIRFEDIRDFEVQLQPGSGDKAASASYRIAVALKDGRSVPMRRYFGEEGSKGYHANHLRVIVLGSERGSAPAAAPGYADGQPAAEH